MRYCVCQDGDMFYIQDDPESETYIGAFHNEKEAEKYCDFLNKEWLK